MAATVASPAFQSLGAETTDFKTNGVVRAAADTEYWWNTAGRELASMLNEADYPEEVQRQFLSYFRENICTQLGSRPDDSAGKSAVGWDGTPFEYSFELKGQTKKQAVRFVVDLTQLRPIDKSNPLSIATTQKLVDSLAKKTPSFEDSWYRHLKQWFSYGHLPTNEQQALVDKAGHQSTVVVGFDIYPQVAGPGRLPIMAKVYFPPCFAAAAKGLTRWQATRQAIEQLPNVESTPNILKALGMIGDFLADKPKDWEEGSRYLATDFVAPGKARLKIYMRYPGKSFEEIWDYYTLGGRIPDLDADREKFKDMMDLMSGSSYDEAIKKQNQTNQPAYTGARRKMEVIYFSLSADNPYPAPKLGIYPSNFAPNDEVIAQGLDKWLHKYEWYDGGNSLEERLKTVLYVFSHSLHLGTYLT